MQSLQMLLDAAEAQQTALLQKSAPPPAPSQQHLIFFVEEEGNLREVTFTWQAPSSLTVSMQRSPEAQAEMWQRSTETCLSKLLHRIDPSDSSLDSFTFPSDGHYEALGADETIVSAARSAARRRREHTRTSSVETTPPPPYPLGGRLREDLIFFHDILPETRSTAIERLASLMYQVVPPRFEHGPILVYGAAPPASAAASGFTCVPIDVDADTLLESMRKARQSTGGIEAASRRKDARAMLEAARRLRSTLGCMSVHTREDRLGSHREGDGGDGPAVATGLRSWLRMYEELLVQAAGLRSALDGPWEGIHLLLERGSDPHKKCAELSPHTPAGSQRDVEICDAHCGGGTLVMRGERGVSSVLRFVQREPRKLLLCRARYTLAEQLRERLGCIGVDCVGAPLSTDQQVVSLRRLLTLLRSASVLLPQDGGLDHVAISIGTHRSPCLRKGRLDSRWTLLEPGRAAIKPGRTELHLPSVFDEHEVMELLCQLERREQRGHPLSQQGGGPLHRGRGHGISSRTKRRRHRARR